MTPITVMNYSKYVYLCMLVGFERKCTYMQL